LSRTLGIVGVGLIGGSVGLAARNAGWEVVGVDRPEVLEKAEELGAVDRASTLKEVRGADLVVLAAPISKVTALLSELAPTDALVTDVASAKSAIVRAAEGENLRFVGATRWPGASSPASPTRRPSSSTAPATSHDHRAHRPRRLP
jgi:prephenate dehydrogenase